ncbi:MAG: YidC/Oxa1 family membrane protein insertase [Leptonema sp. (in: bacteria)]
MQEKKQEVVSSLLPIMILGISTILIFQFLDLNKPHPVKQDQEQIQDNLEEKQKEKKEFDYDNKNLTEKEFLIETEKNIFILDSLGGRIKKIYVKNSPTVNIPKSIIEVSTDPFEKKYNALEITRYKGMDFQPHLYKNQIAEPILNKGIFDFTTTENEHIIQVQFSKRIAFRDHNLILYKIYRFLKKENFFHQIIILQNNQENDFILNGDLFFKTFSALGPEPEDKENSRILASYGRFYNYNDSLKTLPAFGMNQSIFSCNGSQKGTYSIFYEKENSLKYLGINSRYFISYSKFLETENGLHLPDGIILLNHPPYDGSASFTTVFVDFQLSKKQSEDLKIFKANSLESTESISGFHKLLKEDKKRTDALIIDQIVFLGLKTDEEHKFFNKEIQKQEFGLNELDSSIRDVIYTSGFLALFSKLRDWIVILMRFTNSYVNNYGFTIILIALFFKLLTYPLNQVQAKTMKKIHNLKPEIDRINEKYQDPAERQKRIMDLYKKHKINPAMGCFPILIQIPIFIALYSAFAESIELWKSPFIFWMKDLSQPDTIYVIKNFAFLNNFHINILPLIMVGSQLLQQKLTMVSLDPQQKFLMYFMPILMLFFFWGMPSGVTLYWTVQNIISILWQLIVEKFSKSET